MQVEVKITAWHAGWFEFRLAVPHDGGADTSTPITQALLNQHVLHIDPSTPEYDSVTDYTSVGGAFKCSTSGGHDDPTASSANSKWPHGSCCNGGGACSPPHANTDRYIMQAASSTSDCMLMSGAPTLVTSLCPPVPSSALLCSALPCPALPCPALPCSALLCPPALLSSPLRSRDHRLGPCEDSHRRAQGAARCRMRALRPAVDVYHSQLKRRLPRSLLELREPLTRTPIPHPHPYRCPSRGTLTLALTYHLHPHPSPFPSPSPITLTHHHTLTLSPTPTPNLARPTSRSSLPATSGRWDATSPASCKRLPARHPRRARL